MQIFSLTTQPMGKGHTDSRVNCRQAAFAAFID